MKWVSLTQPPKSANDSASTITVSAITAIGQAISIEIIVFFMFYLPGKFYDALTPGSMRLAMRSSTSSAPPAASSGTVR